MILLTTLFGLGLTINANSYNVLDPSPKTAYVNGDRKDATVTVKFERFVGNTLTLGFSAQNLCFSPVNVWVRVYYSDGHNDHFETVQGKAAMNKTYSYNFKLSNKIYMLKSFNISDVKR